MPESTNAVAVLNLDAGVSQEAYEQALRLMRDEMNRYRREQDWCPEFWFEIQNTVSGVFSWDRMASVAEVNAGTQSTDAGRAEELRNIRGRLLRYVGERITLERLNEAFRNSGFPEYNRKETEPVWLIRFPGFNVNVASATDPTQAVREKFLEFLDGISDRESAYHASRLYASTSDEGYHVPAEDSVPLLNR